jgi:hypothetical protein
VAKGFVPALVATLTVASRRAGRWWRPAAARSSASLRSSGS